jgi:diphosphomevalonate decarboxylase
VGADLDRARRAIAAKDFALLAEVAEASALKMHASALAAQPGLIYWSPATVACLHEIRTLRAAGSAVFFTVDAGPQVKAVCLPGEGAKIATRLSAIEGVEQVIQTHLGPGAGVLA